MPAGSIIIDLLMKTGSFETDTKRAERLAKKSAKEIEKAFDSMGSSIKGALLTITGGLGVAGLVALGRSVVENVSAMNDLSDATGVTVENISALEDVARRTGTSVDAVGSVLLKFNSALQDASSNKELAEVFKRLNLEVDELKRLDPAEALLKTAQAFYSFADGGDRARAMQIVFGKLTRESASYLKELAERGELSATVTRRQADEMEAFGKQVASLQADLTQLARSIVGDLIPSVSALIREFNAGREAFGSFGGALLNIGLGPAFKSNLEALQTYKDKLANVQALQKQMADGTMASRTLGLLGVSREKLDEKEQTIRKFITYYEKLMGLTDRAGQGRGVVNPPSAIQKTFGDIKVPDKERKSAAERQSDADRYLESLKRQLEATYDLTASEKVFNDIQEGRLAKATAAQKALAFDIAGQIDSAKAAKEAWEDEKRAITEVFKAEAERNAALEREAASIFEATRTPAEKLGQEIERLNVLLNAGKISWDTYARAQFAAQDAFEKATENAKKATDALDDFAKNAAENIQRSLGDDLVDLMNGNWKSIGDGFKRMLDRMVAEALAANITRALFGDAGKGGGLLGDVLPMLGSVLGFGGARAGGGGVDGGRAYLVGEQGPELFVPATAGRVYSAPQTAAMAGGAGMQVRQTFVLNGPADLRTQQQIAAAAARGLAAANARMN